MLKNILKILGLVVIVAILCFVGVKMYTSYQAAQYDAAAVPFLEKVIPEISTWQEANIRKSMSPEGLEKISPENFSMIVARFSRLGALRSFETPRFDEVAETRAGNALRDGGSVQKSVTYVSEAVYENGDATITLKLSVNDGQLALQYFNIQSLALSD